MQDYLKAAMGEIAAYRKSAESLLDGDALAAMDRFGDVSADDVGTMRVLDQNEIEISALSVTVSLLRQYRIQKGATFTQRQTEVYTAAYRLALEDLIDTLYDLITAGARTRVRKYRESGHIR